MKAGFTVIGVVSLVVAAAFIWLSAFRGDTTARLRIENQSEELISELQVTVSGNTISLGALAPGEKKEVALTRYSDSQWIVEGQWASGAKIHEQAGYITHGASFNDQAVFSKQHKFAFNRSGPS